MLGYVVVGVDCDSGDAFDAYVRDADRTIEAFGRRCLVATRDVDVREGSWPEIAVIL